MPTPNALPGQCNHRLGKGQGFCSHPAPRYKESCPAGHVKTWMSSAEAAASLREHDAEVRAARAAGTFVEKAPEIAARPAPAFRLAAEPTGPVLADHEMTITCPTSEFSERFIQGMLDRMSVSFHKYGAVADAYPDRVQALPSLEKRLAMYLETHNLEYLMDAANFAMIEFMCPADLHAFYLATDSSGSPGRVRADGSLDQEGNLSEQERADREAAAARRAAAAGSGPARPAFAPFVLHATCPEGEYSLRFFQSMLNAMSVSFHKYGAVADAYPDRVQALPSLEKRLAMYAETHNLEYLVDVANFAMIEFMCPADPEAFYQATDSSGSPGRVFADGSTSQGANLSAEEQAARAEALSRRDLLRELHYAKSA